MIPKTSPCFPSCYTWEDQREYDATEQSWKGKVIDENGNEFGSFIKDSPCELREKFFTLFLVNGSGLGAIFKIAWRIVGIVTCDWIRAGYDKAHASWQQKRRIWSIDQAGSCPKFGSLFIKIVSHSLWQLAKNIAKLATYAFAGLILTIISFYGVLANPWDARKAFAAVENFWSRNIVFDLWIGDYQAPCMQPRHIWEQRNFYAQWMGYKPDSLPSLFRDITHDLTEQQRYFVAEGVDVTAVLDNLKANRSKLSQLKEQEPKATQFSQQLALTLRTLQKTMSDLERKRDAIVNAKPADLENCVTALGTSKQNLMQAIAKLPESTAET